ncbi:MAG: hypothetical protein IT437_07140 [Phycisphaerales bacterium]|nr:hypothetical protein [Phycisphaerales bacterium]
MSTLVLGDARLEEIATVGGLCLGGLFILFLIIATVMEERRKLAQTREFEQTRREIAAYVAEGTVSPDDAAKMLEPGRPIKQRIIDRVMGKA